MKSCVHCFAGLQICCFQFAGKAMCLALWFVSGDGVGILTATQPRSYELSLTFSYCAMSLLINALQSPAGLSDTGEVPFLPTSVITELN